MKILEKIQAIVLYSVVFLLPIAFAPISPNPQIPIKMAVLVFGISLLLILKSAETILKGKLDWKVGKFDLPIAILCLAYILGAYFKTPSKMEAVFLPGTTTAVVGSAILYLLINQLSKARKQMLVRVLFASGVSTSLMILISASGVLENASVLPAYLQQRTFTPVGGYLPSAIFLTILLPFGANTLLSYKEIYQKILVAISGAVVLFALLISVYNLLPGQPTALRLPGYNASWTIAVDSLKESPLLGIGPANYITAFNRFRPIEFNNTDTWQLKFSTANSFYITSLTETGMLGLAGILLILYAVYKMTLSYLKSYKGKARDLDISMNMLSMLLLVVILLFLPATALVVALLFIVLSLATETKKTAFSLSTQASSEGISSKVPAVILTLPVLVLVIFVSFRAFQFFAAEYRFKTALDAIARNEGLNSYNLLRETVTQNPFVDRYRARYSQVNLALANNLASQASQALGEGEQISDSDRQQIAQLVQQAIREARAAVTLNPTRAANWELLGRTYQAIIPLANGADTFAAQSFANAVSLDPINPNLRIALGGMFYAAGDYQNAINIFGLAVRTKPDLANAHYNLAFALKEAGQLERARESLQTVLALVDRDSNDYEIARQALEDLESLIPAQGSSENLTPPQESEDAILEPPLDLSEEEEPPPGPELPESDEEVDEDNEGEEEPTVSPEVTPTPTIIP